MPRRAALRLCLAGLTVTLAAAPVVTMTSATAFAHDDEPNVIGDSAPVAATYGPDAADPAKRTAARLPSAQVRAAAVKAIVLPISGVALPVALDVRPTYQGQISCDPVDKVGAVALGKLLVNTYRTGNFGVSRWCDGSQSEHAEGRAVDWMLNAADPTQKAVADSALAWMTANSGENARRLGVQYLIFNKQMWRAYAPERGWQPYSGVSPHTDHIHISLTWDGAYQQTSWWTGRALTSQDLGPCRVYTGQYAPIHSGRRVGSCPATVAPPTSMYPVYTPGQKGDNIKLAQSKLGITADGSFGYGTRTAVLAYQAKVGIPVTGVLDKATWVKLVPDATNATPPAPAPAPAPKPAPPVAITPPALKKVPATLVTQFSPYAKVRLVPGSTGTAVRALQGGLGIKRSGTYDTATTRAVVALQRAWRLPATGRMDLKTWNRLDLRVAPWLGYVNTTLRRGAAGAPVKALQQAVKVGVDGQFGAQTAAAVMTVQARYGLAASGVVDPRTWRAIADNAR